MTAEGVLDLWHGSRTASAEVKNVAIAEGIQFDVGGYPFTISRVVPKGNELELVLEVETPSGVIGKFLERMKFFDPSGKEIPSWATGYSSYALGDPSAKTTKRHTFTYELKAKIPSANVQYTIWIDLQEKKIPFKIRSKQAP